MTLENMDSIKKDLKKYKLLKMCTLLLRNKWYWVPYSRVGCNSCNCYLCLVAGGVSFTPSPAGTMLVRVTSSPLLSLFSFLTIARCASRDHSWQWEIVVLECFLNIEHSWLKYFPNSYLLGPLACPTIPKRDTSQRRHGMWPLGVTSLFFLPLG